MRIRKILRSQSFFLVLVILGISIVAGSINPRFAARANILAILQQISVLGIVTMGMTLLLLSGNLDLSYAGLIGLVTASITVLVIAGWPLGLAITVGVVMCILAGGVNGFIVSKTGAEPLIVTLGMGYVYRGFALVITQGRFLSLPRDFAFLGRGRVLGIPFPIYVLVVITIGTHLLLTYTRFGRRLMAVGGNRRMAFLSGINVHRYIIGVYAVASGLVALASLVLLSRIGSVLADIGSGYELRALAAAIIGGVTFEGARGTVWGAFLGVILLGVVSNAMNILNVSSYFQTAVLGFIIVIAVTVSHLNRGNR